MMFMNCLVDFGKRDLNLALIVPLLALISFQTAASALKVDNFALLDQSGAAHELYYNREAKAVVLITHGNGCQLVRNNLADYKQLRDDYQASGIEVLMINSNLQDNRKSIAREAEEWGIDFPILDDTTQMIGRSLELNRTAEVLLINPQTRRLVYRGPLNDRTSYERQKTKASKTYVRDALDAMLAGKEVEYQEVGSPGCIINFDDVQGDQISYSKTIAPLLKENCMACHIENGIAPWAMSEYNMVKGFAPMMREVIRTKRMPPWHADPEIGHWANDAGLSDQETTILLSWIEAGAPRGDGPDPLTEVKPLETNWVLGEPDLIIDIPEFEVPAAGIVDYQFPVVANPLDKDVWVVAAAIIPGDTKAVHHILAGSSATAPKSNTVESIFENFILAYAPGNEASHMPEGTGVLVPKGGVFQFQMHYTPYGKKSVDQSKIGLYFANKPPKNFYREQVLLNPQINIPANASAHEEHAYYDFANDALIHAVAPHSHYRGRSSVFELLYSDGRQETILSVPNYDFNWQRTYKLVEPKAVPAGTRIIHRTVYDNSSNNRGNPDPDSDIRWGLQSHEEMLYGTIGYTWVNETTKKPIHDYLAAEVAKMVGFLDQDMDGKVSKQEMPVRMLKGAERNWVALDGDQDGSLNLQEMITMMKNRKEAQGE